MNYFELLALAQLISTICAASLIVYGARKRSAGRVILGIAQLSVYVTLIVWSAGGGDTSAMILGYGAAALVAIGFFVHMSVLPDRPELFLSLAGAVACWAYIFLLNNTP